MYTDRMDPKILSGSYLMLTVRLCHSHMRILTWLCTCHCPLNGHLHKIKLKLTKDCAHCPGTKEDILHYLFACPHYDHQQHQMFLALGRRARSLLFLLADQKGMEHLIRYVVATSRSQIRRNSQPEIDCT